MRGRILFTPSLVPPEIGRRWRRALILLLLPALLVAARFLFGTIRRVASGETIYGHLIFQLFVMAYLLYLLIKLLVLPPAEDPNPQDPTS
jgi:hypothetical protein